MPHPVLGFTLSSIRHALLCGGALVALLPIAGCSSGSDSADNGKDDAPAAAADSNASLSEQVAALAAARRANAEAPAALPIAAPDPPSVSAQTAGSFQLPPDATPPQLLESLEKIDRQIQRVATQQTEWDTPEKIQAEIKRLAKVKLEAASRLAEMPSLPPEMLKHSKRGKLQALSHLVALGDNASATELKQFAETLSLSTDPTLAVESRLVLIGFAMEQLQLSNDPQPVVDLVQQLANQADVLEMPALMTMGQARNGLQQYGYSAAAREVRDHMVQAFAKHRDPNIRAMAEDLANAERYDVLDALRRDLEQGRTVTPAQWQTEAQNLIRRGADLGALRYLSESALHFEVTGMKEFAEVTYESIRSGFADSQDAELRNEQQIILSTYAARGQIIGRSLQVDLPDTTGAPYDYSSLRGRVVLMPFWAAEHPESIAVFRLLESIRDQHPDQVSLLGVNVDFEEASLAQFEREIRLDWPSLRSPDPLQQGIENPLAIQTGVTSFPFVVLIDQQGKVRKIFLTNVGIQEATEKLLQPKTPES